ncbi:MAG TPA: hypothetical protein VLE47_00370 [Candidatus Saccharimonadales bacterium]|nr:hypothetical protein [Candidatus Saccharimonadales bacterium]
MAKIIYTSGEKEKHLTEDMKGEESVSGSMPDAEDSPEINDTTEAEHAVGLYLEETEEKPEEAGLAEEVEKGEKERWEKG